MANKGGIPLEERLLNNAVDTVVKNRDRYDPPALIHLVQEIVARDDLAPSIYRILATSLSAEQLKSMGIHQGMAGVSDDAMNFMTMPRLHRTLLRGVQQMQEKLMPGGFLMTNKDVDHADATRMLRDCTTQLSQILRLTKSVRANAEVLRLKEAFAAGLEAIGSRLGPTVQEEAYKIMNEAIRDSLGRSKTLLDNEMEEAESL